MAKVESNNEDAWPARPWIMATVGALAGGLFWLLIHGLHYDQPITSAHLVRQSAAALVMVAALSFIITAEKARWTWAVGFALICGAVMALVGYFTGAASRSGEVMDFPFLSGMLAVGIAGPLFQTFRDKRALPYDRFQRYVWTDAIVGAASLAFTGLTFLVAMLFGALFRAIGISLLHDLLQEGLFNFPLAGAAFGAASAVLRERDPLLGTLQRLVTLVFALLAPVLAVALVLFLVALPLTGLGGLWQAGLPETPLLLSAAGLAFVFLNAILGGSGQERSSGKLWRITEVSLLAVVLPLGLLALVSMGLRVQQYGWTPERLWGVIACLVAIAFGVADWLALWRGRAAFEAPLHTYQKRLAIAVCGLALALALPIADFGAISAASQLARLNAGKVTIGEFDWRAMAEDFGPAGRRSLQSLSQSGAATSRTLAKAALSSTHRFDVDNALRLEQGRVAFASRARILPDGATVSAALREAIVASQQCDRPCLVYLIDPSTAMVAGHAFTETIPTSAMFKRDAEGGWALTDPRLRAKHGDPDLVHGKAEIGTVARRQLMVDGQPVGDPFE